MVYNVIIHFKMSSSCVVEEDNNEVCVLHVEEKVNTTENVLLFKESSLLKCENVELVFRFRSN